MARAQPHHIGDVLARLTAAVFGGYVLASLAPLALVSLFQLAYVNTVLIATMSTFAVYTAAILWAFAARTAWHAWAGLLAPIAVAALLWFGRGLVA